MAYFMPRGHASMVWLMLLQLLLWTLRRIGTASSGSWCRLITSDWEASSKKRFNSDIEMAVVHAETASRRAAVA